MDYVNEIVQLAGVIRPTKAPKSADWNAVEKQLGVTFPKDFKAIVSALGSGWFGIGFGLRSPCEPSEYARLSRKQLLSYAKLVAESARRSCLHLYPETNGLVPIGGMDRQGLLLSRSKSSSVLQSTVWWDMDYHVARRIRMSVSRLLYDLYLGRLRGDWAARMRNYIWREGTAPFFTQWRGPSQ